MKRSSRVVGLLLVAMLILSAAIPAVFGAPPFVSGNKDKPQGMPEFVYQKHLEKYTEMNGELIRVKNKGVKFDTPPVLKGGRTLIPVRAVTEALGATVEWDPDKEIATITGTNKDGEEVVIKFWLDGSGKVTVDGETVEIDVPPGMINNRTYVPLRFIAEVLGLKVGYNDKDGSVNINEEPRLSPKNIGFEDADDIKDVEVKLIMDEEEYTFIKIKELTSDDYDEEDGVVTIYEEYIADLEAKKTVLTFVFEDSDEEEIEKAFTITLDFIDEVKLPTLSPESLTLDVPADYEDTEIQMTLHDHTFIEIEGLEEDEDYEVTGSKVTLFEEYLLSLEEGKTTLTFIFENDDEEEVEVEFEIEVE